MKKPDRHNEIEINYFTSGSITYLFQGSKITIPENSLSLFWGLVPHQIIDYTGSAPYYVCTIPLTQFLEWKLPSFFTDRILRGEVIIEDSGEHSTFDRFLFKNWEKDLAEDHDINATLYEMRARLLRLTSRFSSLKKDERLQIDTDEISKVEQIALFIAQNFMNPIKVSDIGRKIELHPDYANLIFKKAFETTINNFIIQERIMHAQRKLITSDKKIADIAFDCGFNSINRFNAAFRKLNNCTPREYRKKYL
ncbi:helix-turn-helix domain-containing protein [Antarcticibacterium sp. 1MA-6-2]|uniref:helix-turn-helix domain-containing protein n=1 Tax=Antarcticibacterium sp. 1MA-6-2 TaxID=2908210 RepID=UPI001F160429|nr:helix-turn-helix domain-containing protein [Antarcticibacterium sp. 1MA-6-2]UJH91652.1 helix-turn-helix domain-containing protein [Antarcticibacterium sp. 1MA-6-2]